MGPTMPALGAAVTSDQRRRRQGWLDWAGTLSRAGLAVVWIWAGLAKLTDPNGAVLSVRAYWLLPDVLVRPVAWGLPFLELALAVLLLAGIANRIAGAASAGLLVVFMLGIASAWARGLQIDCGCFSAGGPDASAGCAAFEATVGPTIRRLVDQGKIRFVYHPMAFLGPESIAAANAATCAGDQGKFWPYHDLLFSQQAAENSGFLSTDHLLRFGEQVGASDSRFTGCVKDDSYVPWVHRVTDQASRRGVNATPTILINGRVEPTATTAQGLLAAVAAASR